MTTASAPVDVRSYIAGEWRDSSTIGDDINPARPAEVVARIHFADATAASDAISAARSSYAAWRATAAPARGVILSRAADLLQARHQAIAIELSREEGKTLGEAIGETRRAAAIIRYYAAQTLEPDGETFPSHSATTFLYARREPVGVVLAITPWNFPIAIPAWKIAPALAYGNTVVLKPSETAPLSAARLVEVFHEAGLPLGVLNLVVGKSAVIGDLMVDDPQVDAITFTGSNSIGHALQARAVARGAKVQLELGGKNPAVVAADANLAQAAEHVARGAFLSAGQKCTATSRVIVDERVYAAFSDQLALLAGEWKVGDPLTPDTKVGPVISLDRLEAVMGYVELGRQGGRVLAGGERPPGDGYFLRPTVIADLAADSRPAREEIFGPVAVLLRAADFVDAVRLANDTPFGLSASLFTGSLEQAIRFAGEIQAGVVKINQESAGLEFQAPFGGFKASSSGSREQGKVARDFFTQWKTVYIDPPSGG